MSIANHLNTPIEELPENLKNDPLFMVSFFSNERVSIENINSGILSQISPYILLKNPQLFFDYPHELQTQENLDIAIVSNYELNKSTQPYLEYIATLDDESIVENLFKHSKYLNINSAFLPFFKDNFESLKVSDIFIKGFMYHLLYNNQKIPKELWEARSLNWWIENREAFSFNIFYPNFNNRNKFFYQLEDIPEEFLLNKNFALALGANCFSIIKELPNFTLDTDNSLKILATYIYTQEHQKLPDTTIYDDLDECLKIVKTFIFDKQEDKSYLDYDSSSLQLLVQEQFYIANLLSPFFAEFSYDEIKDHPYWDNKSLNHLALNLASASPSFHLLKSFNEPIKLYLLIDTVRSLTNLANIYAEKCTLDKLYVYIIQDLVIDGQTIQQRYNFSLTSQDTSSTLSHKFNTYVLPLLEYDYQLYIIPEAPSQQIKVNHKF